MRYRVQGSGYEKVAGTPNGTTPSSHKQAGVR